MFIDGKKVDEYQLKAIKEEKNTLLIAAAGSGKTFTIRGKINYLITKGIKEEEILVISFTNKSVNDLKEKIKINADIYTFHKLAIAILKYNNVTFKIAPIDTLDYLTNEFFYTLDEENIIKILKYTKYYDYPSFLKSFSFQEIKKIIISFIHLYKTNNKTIADIKKIYPTDTFLMTLIIKIMYIYQNELKSTNSFDFDDLIIMATKYSNNFKKYKYIIIDEFQDTSLIRWNLINNLRCYCHAKIFAVGDDYQSIFKFSGCDIEIFLNFLTIVEDATIHKLKYTYRNSQELINVSTKFIMQNKKQIKKEIVSNKHLKKPIIIKYYFKRKSLISLLNKVILKYDDILLLGRNNKDIYNYLDVTIDNNGFYYQNKFIKYLTIHSSKGLEADCVILINLEDSFFGLPIKIENNKLINELLKTEKYLYAEERRLFYVALTRTKNEVYLFTPFFKKSIFIKEIKKIKQ